MERRPRSLASTSVAGKRKSESCLAYRVWRAGIQWPENGKDQGRRRTEVLLMHPPHGNQHCYQATTKPQIWDTTQTGENATQNGSARLYLSVKKVVRKESVRRDSKCWACVQRARSGRGECVYIHSVLRMKFLKYWNSANFPQYNPET